MSPRLRSPRLVGRAEELDLLTGAVQAAAAGRGDVLVVRGEAGVGKSRLLAEVVARGRGAGAEVLTGRAVEGGGACRPLADALLGLQRRGGLPPPSTVGPFAGALAELAPGWAPPPDRGASIDRSLLVSEGLLRLLRVLGQGSGALLVLDDLHWADADTLDVLDRLTDGIDQTPALVLVAARDTPSGCVERLARRPGHHVRLRRLSATDTAELVRACADDAPLPRHVSDHLLERAEGLPFLVEELLAGLVDGGVLTRTAGGWQAPARITAAVPVSFAAVVHQRMSSLGAGARAVVQAAAVLGRHVDWHVVADVTGQSRNAVLAALRDAVDRGLMTCDADAPDVVHFVHALTRDAVLERLLPPERAALAETAAQVVEDVGRDLVLAASLREQAGHAAAAGRLLLRSAERAGALGTREQLLRRAAVLCPEDADVAVALVRVLALAGKAVEARETGDPLLAALLDDDPLRSALALVLARACLTAGSYEDAARYLDLAGDGPAVQALAAHVAFVRQRPDDADHLARAVARSDDPAVRCEALELVGRVARLRDRRAEAECSFAEALAVARQHALPLWEIRALHELGTLDMLGPARTDRLEAARALALRSGVLSTAAVLDLQIAAAHALRMDHGATLDVARRGIELAESLRLHALVGALLVFSATAHGHQGQAEDFSATLEEAERRLQHDPDKLAAARFARGTLAMAAHDVPSWRAALHDGMALLRRNPSASPSPCRGQHALLETVLGDGRAEREELRRSGATVQACNRGALAYADAVAVARAGGDPEEHLARAEAVMEPLTWRRHHMHVLVAACAVRDGWGRPVDWLRDALAYSTAVGAHGLARACRLELRAAGAPVPRRGRGDSDVPPPLRRQGVTSREMDVLALVALGRSNAAIAADLVLSPRTVETHVASLLRKTGATRRAELRHLLQP